MNGFKDFLMHKFQMVDLKEIIFFWELEYGKRKVKALEQTT
jgi:hypothetical protein